WSSDVCSSDLVGARERHDLRGADLADRTGRDDRALTLHEARHRRESAESAAVGERDGRAGEVVGEQLVGASLLDQGLVGRAELREIHPFGVLDHRDDERAAAVLLLDVHGETEMHRLRVEAVRLALDVLEGVGHYREAARRLYEGVAD